MTLASSKSKEREFDFQFSTGELVRVRYRQFDYELGSATTNHKLQGATKDFLLGQLNENPNAKLRLTIESLLVLLSRARGIEFFKILPMFGGTKALDYLKKLKLNPKLRVLDQCYNDQGVFIGTPESVEKLFDKYSIDWKPKGSKVKKTKTLNVPVLGEKKIEGRGKSVSTGRGQGSGRGTGRGRGRSVPYQKTSSSFEPLQVTPVVVKTT